MSSSANRREFLQGKALLRTAREIANSAIDQFGLDFESQTSAEGYLSRYSFPAMGCEFEFLLPLGQENSIGNSVMTSFELIELLEQQLSIYRESSEISELNRRAANLNLFHEPVEVEPRLFALLQTAQQLWRESGGAYDITSGSLSHLWGFTRREGRLPSEPEIAEALEHVGTQHLILDPDSRAISFSRAGVQLNLGSIGKGYALDRCAVHIAARQSEISESENESAKEPDAKLPTPNYMIHGGNSSILARGSRTATDAGWWVGIRDPLRPERRIFEVRLQNTAIGTSGAAVQHFIHGGKRYGHILDPRTGWPATEILSTTVIAPTSAMADALSTMFYVLGLEKTLAYLESHPDIGALIFVPGEKANTWRMVSQGIADENLREL